MASLATARGVADVCLIVLVTFVVPIHSGSVDGSCPPARQCSSSSSAHQVRGPQLDPSGTNPMPYNGMYYFATWSPYFHGNVLHWMPSAADYPTLQPPAAATRPPVSMLPPNPQSMPYQWASSQAPPTTTGLPSVDLSNNFGNPGDETKPPAASSYQNQHGLYSPMSSPASMSASATPTTMSYMNMMQMLLDGRPLSLPSSSTPMSHGSTGGRRSNEESFPTSQVSPGQTPWSTPGPDLPPIAHSYHDPLQGPRPARDEPAVHPDDAMQASAASDDLHSGQASSWGDMGPAYRSGLPPYIFHEHLGVDPSGHQVRPAPEMPVRRGKSKGQGPADGVKRGKRRHANDAQPRPARNRRRTDRPHPGTIMTEDRPEMAATSNAIGDTAADRTSDGSAGPVVATEATSAGEEFDRETWLKIAFAAILQDPSSLAAMCPYCDYQHRSRSVVKAHLHRHMPVRTKRYSCDVCDKWFMTRGGRSRHQKSKSHAARAALAA